MTKQFITLEKIKKLEASLKLSIPEDEMDDCAEKLAKMLEYVSQLDNMDIIYDEFLFKFLSPINNSTSDGFQASITQDFTLRDSAKMSGDFFQVLEAN